MLTCLGKAGAQGRPTEGQHFRLDTAEGTRPGAKGGAKGPGLSSLSQVGFGMGLRATEVPNDKGSGMSGLEYTCCCCPVFDS